MLTSAECLPLAPFRAVCLAIVEFLRGCIASDCKAARLTQAQYFAGLLDTAPAALDAYEAVLQSLCVSKATTALQRALGLALHEYLAALPEACGRRKALAAPAVSGWLRKWLLHTPHEPTQEAMADAVGVMAHGTGAVEVDRLAASLATVAENKNEQVTERYGATIGLGALLAETIPGGGTAEGPRFLLSEERRASLVSGMCESVRVEKHEAVRRALCVAIGRCGTVAPLPLTLGEFPAELAEGKSEPEPEDPPAASASSADKPADSAAAAPPSRAAVFRSLVVILEDSQAKGRVCELAATALGQLCLGDRSLVLVRACQVRASPCTP